MREQPLRVSIVYLMLWSYFHISQRCKELESALWFMKVGNMKFVNSSKVLDLRFIH